MKRLAVPTGIIEDEKSVQGDTVTRHALLVHSGPNGKKITFMSGDGEISFDDERIQEIVKQHNKKIKSLARGYGGMEKMPIGAFPPILDQHVDDSTDRVRGRLNSLLSYEVRDVPGVGKQCSCVMADITFIGEDTVKRVGDGRIYHLSIGIDEETNTLGETSIVITPAAPGAMLLKKGDTKMALKKLEAHKSKMAKLKAMKEGLTGLTKKVVAANENVKLAKKQGEISHRLTSLVRGGKLTPAEFKKMDVKKLAALPAEQIDTLISAFESMEPKVLAGQRGSTASLNFSEIGKGLAKSQMSKLKAEIKGDLKKMGAKGLGFDKEEDIEDKEHKMSVEDSYKKEMGKEDKEEEKELEMGDVKSEDVKKSAEEFQVQIDELNMQVARIAGMVDELISAEQEEGEELAKADHEEEPMENPEGKVGGKEMSEGFADEESKKLEEDKKEDEKKELSEEDKEEKKLAEEKEKEEIKKDLKKSLKRRA